jgi:hypothetical protein
MATAYTLVLHSDFIISDQISLETLPIPRCHPPPSSELCENELTLISQATAVPCSARVPRFSDNENGANSTDFLQILLGD